MLAFWSSLALDAFTTLSNPSFATVYPSSRPKFIPLSIPSSNFSSNFLPKFCSSDFRPFSYPSLYARFHSRSRFSFSNLEVVAARKQLIELMSASLIKSRNATRVRRVTVGDGGGVSVVVAVTVSEST